MNFSQFDYTLAANQSARIDATGTFLKMLYGTGPVRVRLDNGQAVDLMPGRGLRMESGRSFNYFTVLDRSGAANVGLFVCGDEGLIDDRISGEVSVIDGGKVRTLSNVAYAGFAYQSAVAAQFSRVQLWNNNAAGGRNLVVNSCILLAGVAASPCHVKLSNVALATLVQVGQAKLGGGIVSTAQIKTDTTAVASAAPVLGALAVPASVIAFYKPTEPIYVPAQWGLLFYGTVANVDLGATFEWYEE